MKWGLKGGISIDADSGPPRYVLWCCGGFCHQLLTFFKIGWNWLKLFRPFTFWINCSSDCNISIDSWPSASNFISFSWSPEQYFLTVGQNNFGNKIPFLSCYWRFLMIKYIWTIKAPIGTNYLNLET